MLVNTKCSNIYLFYQNGISPIYSRELYLLTMKAKRKRMGARLLFLMETTWFILVYYDLNMYMLSSVCPYIWNSNKNHKPGFKPPTSWTVVRNFIHWAKPPHLFYCKLIYGWSFTSTGKYYVKLHIKKTGSFII